jgi:hypothetical protein
MFVECTVEYPQCLPPTAYAFGQYSFPELSAPCGDTHRQRLRWRTAYQSEFGTGDIA